MLPKKQKLEKATGIYLVVVDALLLLASSVGLVYFVIDFIKNSSTFVFEFAGYVLSFDVFEIGVALVLVCFFAIISLVLATKLVKNPRNEDGSFERKTGTKIMLLIVSLILVNYIGIILLIITMCLNDGKAEQTESYFQETETEPLTDLPNDTQPIEQVENQEFETQEQENNQIEESQPDVQQNTQSEPIEQPAQHEEKIAPINSTDAQNTIPTSEAKPSIDPVIQAKIDKLKEFVRLGKLDQATYQQMVDKYTKK